VKIQMHVNPLAKIQIKVMYTIIIAIKFNFIFHLINLTGKHAIYLLIGYILTIIYPIFSLKF